MRTFSISFPLDTTADGFEAFKYLLKEVGIDKQFFSKPDPDNKNQIILYLKGTSLVATLEENRYSGDNAALYKLFYEDYCLVATKVTRIPRHDPAYPGLHSRTKIFFDKFVFLPESLLQPKVGPTERAPIEGSWQIRSGL